MEHHKTIEEKEDKVAEPEITAINKRTYNLIKRRNGATFFNPKAVSDDLRAFIRRVDKSGIDMYHMLVLAWKILYDEENAATFRPYLKKDIAALLHYIDTGTKKEDTGTGHD